MNDSTSPPPTSAAAILSQPLQLPGGGVFKNRIFKAAMSEVIADPDTGAPSERLLRLYQRWGRSGAGALITGHVIVDRGGVGEIGNVIVEDDRHLPALRRWAEAAQAHGSALVMQINHAGRQTPRKVIKQPVAPSAVAMRGFFGAFAKPRALTGPEIEGLVQRFATTAGVAKAAGFSGVELHGAHGYLISQFLSPLTNLRDDEWGGDLAGRMRFLLAVVAAVRAEVGAGFPLLVKLNSADFQRGGFGPDEAMQVARALQLAGVDLIEVTGGNYESPAMAGGGALPVQRASTVAREAYFLAYAQQLRAAVPGLPLLLTGGLRSAAALAEVVTSGAVSAIGLARPMAFEPDLPAHLLAGAAGATPLTLRTRLRRIHDLLQVYWYQAQIHRMADGLEPDVGLSKWAAIWHGFRVTLFGPGRRKGDVKALPAATQPALETRER